MQVPKCPHCNDRVAIRVEQPSNAADHPHLRLVVCASCSKVLGVIDRSVLDADFLDRIAADLARRMRV